MSEIDQVEWEENWLYCDDNGWYFCSPFDDVGGPYGSKSVARLSLHMFCQLQEGGNVKKELLQEALRANPFTITFKKKDGSLRVLRGTLNIDRIKEGGWVPDDSSERKASPDHLLNVFDLDINEWRYVTVNNVISVE